jgi:hypothetical protein
MGRHCLCDDVARIETGENVERRLRIGFLRGLG